ncbi:SlyX family protein [Treponema sp. OMZ 840]|uniref:SlyX family protein n=1 Tax=Treponema sp. OMZ 840 TaxID=244313 RepID=UPI003D8A2B41
MENNETVERCTHIEIKLAYLEDFIKGMQKVTLEHEKRLDALSAENKALRQKVAELAENQEGALPHIRPPHY